MDVVDVADLANFVLQIVIIVTFEAICFITYLAKRILLSAAKTFTVVKAVLVSASGTIGV